MFGRLSERIIRVVRWSLVAGWLLIIASLIFDPLSARLTNPEAALSPFRINRAASAAAAGDRYRCPGEADVIAEEARLFQRGRFALSRLVL